MVYYYPEHSWDPINLLDATRFQQRRLHAKQPQPVSRRRSLSKPLQYHHYQSSTASQQQQQQQPHLWPYYYDDEQDIYEPPFSYRESYEIMPDDLTLDDDDDDEDDYMDAPSPRWSSFATRPHPPPPQRRRSLASHHYQPDHYYDDAWYDDNKNNGNNQRMVPRRRQQQQPNSYYNNHARLYRRRSLGPSTQRRTTTWDVDYSDEEEEEEKEEEEEVNDVYYYQEKTLPSRRRRQQQQQRQYGDEVRHKQYHQHRTPWINSPQVMGSPESITSSPVLRHARMEQGPPPLLSIDTQHQQPHLPPTSTTTATSYYGQAPPQMLPMPQPMMPPPLPGPSSFLPHYGFPTMPPVMPALPPAPALPFNPMMMPQPQQPFLQEKQQPPPPPPASSSASPSLPAPSRPSSDDTKSPSSAPDLTTTTASPSTTTTTTKGENGLVPLARSLSLGTSQPLRTKPRRRSLFGSLFGPPLPSDTTTDDPRSTGAHQHSATASPSLIPVHALTKDSLTRKQSLSLEKKAKALSQRSYIWCYRIKPSLTHPHNGNNEVWMAMAPRNQTKLDPYLVFYQPGAVVKGLLRTETLPTLVTLDKEPKLSGSITAMPQAKIARVYPSMFSSSNYLELIIDCLPADSQFVVQSD